MSIGAGGYGSSRQLAFCFGGGRPPPPPPIKRTSDNVYFAVLPDPEVAHRMTEIGAELRKRHQLSGRAQPAHLLHISLAHVGTFSELPEVIVSAARRAGAAVRVAPFDVSFDRVIGLDTRSRHLVLSCSKGGGEFADLRNAVAATMGKAGLRASRSASFMPHVTLVYRGRPVPEDGLAQPITWTVRELVLVHSLVGQGRHIHLGRWPLCGQC